MQFELNGLQVEVVDESASLLEVLRDQFGLTSVKDGCSPQGQCGCCTVLVDGDPRVSCVTPARRVADRSVETLEGLDPDACAAWGAAFCSTGGSQCGFCTPGIVVRLEGLRRKGGDLTSRPVVDRALAAHLCRCTGWQTIVEAAASFGTGTGTDGDRDLEAAARRATIEGGAPQVVGPDVALGHGGFADDLAPTGSLVGVVDGDAGWRVAGSMAEARRDVGKVQGRRSTIDAALPVALPAGEWALTLQTGWVDPAYLETDASWSEPGGTAADPLANGGAFGGKATSPVPAAARAVADEHGVVVRLRWSREDVARHAPKRPPVAVALRADGTGVVHVARTPGIVERIAAVAPHLEIVEVDVPGPPTSADLRAAGWGEVAAVLAALATGPGDAVEITAPGGGWASVAVDAGRVHVRVRCGAALDAVVVRSYCIGAVHMALGWVTSEGLTVDGDGVVASLTVRSFGIVRPAAMPQVTVEIVDEPDEEPVNGSDAVFVAAAAAFWIAQGRPASWPTGIPFTPS